MVEVEETCRGISQNVWDMEDNLIGICGFHDYDGWLNLNHIYSKRKKLNSSKKTLVSDFDESP